MSYGFFAAGKSGNLIIGDDNPVLRRIHSGGIHTTQVANYKYSGAFPAMFAFCEVAYPQTIATDAPPLVFGAPDNSVPSGGGIAAFTPLGSPGAWRGFRVVYKALGAARQLKVGEPIGWTYHACSHESEVSVGKGFGLRLFNVANRVIFDSNWPIVPFRGLLANWSKEPSASIVQVRIDWGNQSYNQSVDLDAVRQFYSHPWGANDGDLGVLISSLSGWEIKGDAGLRGTTRTTIPPTIFFRGSERAKIYCLVDAGVWQHPTIDGQAMNRFSLLTGDLSRL